MKDESKGGPNMGMGHSKGTSCVKCDVLASCVRKYIIINLLKKFKKKKTWEGNKKRKKERTQVQTKDHTPKCRTHDGELLSFCQNIFLLGGGGKFEGLGHSKR
jgi:hypothetical protein